MEPVAPVAFSALNQSNSMKAICILTLITALFSRVSALAADSAQVASPVSLTGEKAIAQLKESSVGREGAVEEVPAASPTDSKTHVPSHWGITKS
jgi:hypothetical protein